MMKLIGRKRFQYSLGTFLALCVVMSIVLSYVCEVARVRKATLSTVAQHLGWCIHKDELEGCEFDGRGRYILKGSNERTDWISAMLAYVLGIDPFRDIVAVEFNEQFDMHSHASDAVLETLPDLPHLVMFNAGGMWTRTNEPPNPPYPFEPIPVTDRGIKSIRGHANLRYLFLSRTLVTDAAMKEIAMIQSLAVLELHRTQITDKGLSLVMELPSLRWLDVSGTSVTDAGVSALCKHASLGHLDIRFTAVSKQCVVEIRQERPDLVVYTDYDSFENGRLVPFNLDARE